MTGIMNLRPGKDRGNRNLEVASCTTQEIGIGVGRGMGNKGAAAMRMGLSVREKDVLSS